MFGRRGPGHPLEDMTAFELVQELGAQSWEWRRWMPPKQRRKKGEPIPDFYLPGDAKVWYSGVEVQKNYLIALLKAEASMLFR